MPYAGTVWVPYIPKENHHSQTMVSIMFKTLNTGLIIIEIDPRYYVYATSIWDVTMWKLCMRPCTFHSGSDQHCRGRSFGFHGPFQCVRGALYMGPGVYMPDRAVGPWSMSLWWASEQNTALPVIKNKVKLWTLVLKISTFDDSVPCIMLFS